MNPDLEAALYRLIGWFPSALAAHMPPTMMETSQRHGSETNVA